jgi:hypothetical protein
MSTNSCQCNHGNGITAVGVRLSLCLVLKFEFEEDMWAVLGRDGQLMSEQETLLYSEVMMMMMMEYCLIALTDANGQCC